MYDHEPTKWERLLEFAKQLVMVILHPIAAYRYFKNDESE